MIENRTASILERMPKILAVTAASYGLSLQHPRDTRAGHDAVKKAGPHKPAARKRMATHQ